MDTQTLTAEARTGTGKGAARQLRATGRIPAVFYGPSAEPQSLSVSPKELAAALSTPWRRNVLIKLQIGGAEHLTMIKELQTHPVTRLPLHADFYEVSPDRPVRVKVPFTTTGRARGVVAGGELNVIYREVPVRAAPDKLPSEIRIDITSLDLNQVLKVKDLAPGEGVEVTLDPERNVVAVVAARRRAASDEEGAEGAGAAASAG